MKDYAKMNEKMSITKAMIMIGNHFDEKFASLKAAFNFFDANGDE
jgi:Ca2+-binding EF-hand superfamily protein